jgi:thiamine-phosphate diphosphorylase
MPRPQLHLVTDSRLPVSRQLDVIATAVDLGVDVVQVRNKPALPDALVALTRDVYALVAGRALVIVNAGIDVALQAGADGVHLPEGHADLLAARQALGPAAYIGTSVHSVAAARRAEQAGVSSLTFGHVYATESHPGEPARGLAALREVVAAVRTPVLAIGGIDVARVADVLAVGAGGVAVVSAVSEAGDPGEAVRGLRASLDRG